MNTLEMCVHFLTKRLNEFFLLSNMTKNNTNIKLVYKGLGFAFIFFVILFFNNNLNAQSVRKVNFSDVEKIMNLKNDTTYLLNFWATWCKTCVAELPNIEKINNEYKDKKVKVILVTLDPPKQLESKLIPFVKERELQSTVWLMDVANANSWINKVDESWSGTIPASLFLNNQKQYKEFYEKPFSYEELDSIVQQILK
jgi:thiol-disulfide isomerase/thioredoxin